MLFNKISDRESRFNPRSCRLERREFCGDSGQTFLLRSRFTGHSIIRSNPLCLRVSPLLDLVVDERGGARPSVSETAGDPIGDGQIGPWNFARSINGAYISHLRLSAIFNYADAPLLPSPPPALFRRDGVIFLNAFSEYFRDDTRFASRYPTTSILTSVQHTTPALPVS